MEYGTGAGVFCDILNIRKSLNITTTQCITGRNFCDIKAIDLLANMDSEVMGPVTIYVYSQAVLTTWNLFTIKFMTN